MILRASAPPNPQRAPSLPRPSSLQYFALLPAGILVKCGPEDEPIAPLFILLAELIGWWGGEIERKVSFWGGGEHATLAALTEAKDSSSLPGRDELSRCWGNALGAGLSGQVGLAPCFRWVLQCPAGC